MIRKFWFALTLLLWWGAGAIAQTSPGVVGNGQIGGNYGSGYAAVNWMPSGTASCPTWLSAAQAYLNTTTSTAELLQIFDGTSCVTLGALNSSAHVYARVQNIANSSSTGTTANALAKLTGAPSTAVIAATSDTGGIIGVVVGGAGTTGTAQIATNGQALCIFDGATTAGDYIQISSSTGGDCHDTGSSSYPVGGQVLGRVLSTNGSGGTYLVELFGPEFKAVPVVNQTLPSVCDIISTSATTCNNGGSAANNGTYTVPTGALWLEITLVGGGGGGGGGNNASGASSGGGSCWNTTGSACSSPVYEAGGGGGGVGGASAAPGAGGTISGSGTCDLAIAGSPGGYGIQSVTSTIAGGGGAGGNSTLGGGGSFTFGGGNGASATGNTGSGGGGGGVTASVSAQGGAGGGSGATCRKIISSLASTYTYAIGAGATGASGGTDGGTGGGSASGHIIVVAHFNY